MSGVDAGPPDLDFWEFVNCARCHLPFSPDTGVPPPVPFWITECGHVICNNHLNPDQSCTQCGQGGIQLMPLQREMDAPMSDWFRSAPLALDVAAYATRFQLDTLATLVRYYKKKCVQQRAMIERIKGDAGTSLKKTIETLRAENARLREVVGHQHAEPSDISNQNGKRQMLDIHRHPNGNHTNSSPRSTVTPIGPDRLTLPPDRQQPNFSSRHPLSDSAQANTFAREDSNEYSASGNRPGSSRFVQQYAYVPPHTPQQAMPLPKLSHAQAPLQRRTQAAQHDHSSAQGQPQGSGLGRAHIATMQPPPQLHRDERTHTQTFGVNPPTQMSRNDQQHQMQMMPPPPPPPQASRQGQLQQRGSFRLATTHQPQAAPSNPPPRRFPSVTPSRNAGASLGNRFNIPQQTQTNRFAPSTPAAGSHRFSAPGDSGSGSGSGSGLASGFGLGSRAPSRSAISGGGQRMPFMPEGQGGFG